MKSHANKTSTWLALRHPVFRRLWLAMVISGSCIGAHNTAVYLALHRLGASTFLISLMATVSALPYTLLTLPAGAIADIVDRKKILLAVLTLACSAGRSPGASMADTFAQSLSDFGQLLPV